MASSSSSPLSSGEDGCLSTPREDKDKSINSKSSTSTDKKKLFPIFDKNYKPSPPPLGKVKREEEEKDLVEGGRKKLKKTMLSKDPKGLEQTILDAGQKHIGPKFCDECGLLYSPGDFEDEEEHRKAHIRIDNTFKLTLWKDARIIFNYPEEDAIIIQVQCDKDGKRVMNRLRDFLAWLDSELGGGYKPSGSGKSEKVFLYAVRTKRKNVVRILGCGIMEQPDPTKISACRFLPNNNDSANSSTTSSSLSHHDDNEEEEDIPNENIEKVRVIIGVTRLWTDSGFRRRQIASKLCEMMRFHSGLMQIIGKEHMGILEPTENGRDFFLKYTEAKGACYTYN